MQDRPNAAVSALTDARSARAARRAYEMYARHMGFRAHWDEMSENKKIVWLAVAEAARRSR